MDQRRSRLAGPLGLCDGVEVFGAAAGAVTIAPDAWPQRCPQPPDPAKVKARCPAPHPKGTTEKRIDAVDAGRDSRWRSFDTKEGEGDAV